MDDPILLVTTLLNSCTFCIILSIIKYQLSLSFVLLHSNRASFPLLLPLPLYHGSGFVREASWDYNSSEAGALNFTNIYRGLGTWRPCTVTQGSHAEGALHNSTRNRPHGTLAATDDAAPDRHGGVPPRRVPLPSDPRAPVPAPSLPPPQRRTIQSKVPDRSDGRGRSEDLLRWVGWSFKEGVSLKKIPMPRGAQYSK